MAAAREIPNTIGRYRVERVLGSGAMGMVYLAHDPVIDRKVAIKLVMANLLSDEGRGDFLDRFAREARAAGRCAHPNIVAIHDFATERDCPYLVMEFVEGDSLAEASRRDGPTTPAAATGIMHQMLAALAAAHAAGIVHRDVKPANILLTRDGHVKMTDFGIARLDTGGITQTGAMVGTPRYMSPEQIDGTAIDHRSDLFSAGVVLYELLCGAPPFDGGSMVEIMRKITSVDPPDPRAANPPVPEPLASVVMTALERDPARRFQSAGLMAAALAEAVALIVDGDQTVVLPKGDPGFALGPGHSGLDRGLDRRPDGSLTGGGAGSGRPGSGRSGGGSPGGGSSAGASPGGIGLDGAGMGGGGGPAAPARGTGSPDGSNAGPAHQTAARGGTISGPITDDALRRAERALAELLGPIAKILVKRAARTAVTEDGLWQALAAHVASEPERKAFLSRRRG